jgi:uncharacterized membrane protein
LPIITIEGTDCPISVAIKIGVKAMKKIVCLILLIVVASFAFGAVSGCQSFGSKSKKKSVDPYSFLQQERP